ncbi:MULTISPECIES: hypothetical protein [Streptomycetaceae]|uniref:Sialidase domain-containing protein n=2 Tax=Streptomyces TaxID=1883 RepID=A0A0N0H3Q1_9ACTN|nr:MULTISPECIES: hypothetical protein [Streptomycetaceae]KPC66170.1 hypothetical protein ADL29_05630 [Streptomyces chattanoogensis]KUM82341.1 hypothetical protein AQI94_42120 [Streptomyces pseudovenezuelae]
MEHDGPADRPLMTMRISRDSGRTWSPVREIWPDDCDVHPWDAIIWPPCACPRHRKGSEINR